MSNRVYPLSSQTTRHFVVIRKNREYPIEVLKKYLNDNFEKWALVVHKDHLDPKDHKTIIPIHYHFLGIYRKSRTPLSTAMNSLSKYLKTNNDGIEYDGYKYFEKALQYLTHKNNPEKTHMEFKDIMFNGWTKEELLTYWSSDDNSINFDRVYFLCRNNKSMLDVIREVGLGVYKTYRNVIMDIWFLAKQELKQEKLDMHMKVLEPHEQEYISRREKGIL